MSRECPTRNIPERRARENVQGGKSPKLFFWRGGRAVECGSLENCYTRKGIGGSNPSLSVVFIS